MPGSIGEPADDRGDHFIVDTTGKVLASRCDLHPVKPRVTI